MDVLDKKACLKAVHLILEGNLEVAYILFFLEDNFKGLERL